MLSSEINTNISSALTVATTGSEFIPILPGPLAAPPGWQSVIIHSNSPIFRPNEINNYEEYNVTNAYNTSQIPSTLINNTTQYNNTSFNNHLPHQQQSLLTEQQQQRNIVNSVETQHPPPLILRKTLPNNQVTYRQNVSVRYLQPPTPPPPGPIIIREIRPPPPPPQPPITIRQRPAPPPTPPPLVLRERPPPAPPQASPQVIEKLLPPAPPASPRVVIERFGACPPKPADVIIERWLPYKQSGQRKVLIERASAPDLSPKEPNLLILHDSPNARIHKQFINEGVVRADPNSYLQQYGTELESPYSKTQYTHLVGEATQAVPPPSIAASTTYDHHTSYSNEYRRAPSPYITNTWERTRVASPIPRSSTYHSYYDSPNHYCNQSSSRYRDDYPSHYCNQSSSRYRDDYPSHYCNQSSSRYRDDYPSHYCNQSSRCGYNGYPIYYDNYRARTPFYDSYYRSSSYHSPDTIRVHSEDEFRRVICDLTDGRAPSTIGSY